MRYTYAYKTSDGTRHEAEIEAPSREAVFEQLRAQGIRAIKVTAADGSKANGEVRGLRKRVAAVIAVIVALVVGGIAFWLGGRGGEDAALPQLTAQARRQVIGDAAVIAKGVRTGWADVFASPGDRFFASFAVPGVKPGVRMTDAAEIERALNESVAASPDDSLEARQIKAMVEGMKQEARRYLAAGGKLSVYRRRLVERQEAEAAVYRRVEAELKSASATMAEDAFLELLDRRNDELRNLGIRPVTLPESVGGR